MNEYELPLVWFTVLCQWSIGGVLALTLLQMTAYGLKDKALRYAALLFWCIGVAGSLMSLAHLGTPLGAYRALRGLAHSWLSREVVAFVLLNAIMTMWLLSTWLKPSPCVRNHLLGLLTALAGGGAILVSAQVYYQMGSHPLWHSPATQMGFFGCALLLGFLSVALLLNLLRRPVPRRISVGVLAGAIVVAAALFIRYQVPGADGRSMLLWWQLAASIAGGVWLAGRVRLAPLSRAGAVIMLACVLSGELTGRMLFYGNVMSGAPWF